MNNAKAIIEIVELENANLKSELADLKAKLAESERKNFELLTKLNLKEYAPAFCKLAGRDCEWLGKEKQLAISELEKVKENIVLNDKYDEEGGKKP